MIDILLATHNGEHFLDEQLGSIFDSQTLQDYRLIARDDASHDATSNVLARWASRQGGRITLLEGEVTAVGATESFSRLMQSSEAPYVAFADQDDVWLPHKLERLHAMLVATEHRVGAGVPLLVHSDLRVVDSKLNPIAESLWKYQKIDPSSGIFPRTLIENTVTGCAMLANRALINLASPVPARAIMHDWWLALTASAFGRIISLAEPLVLYRQHGANSIGAKHWGWRTYWARAKRFSGRHAVTRALALCAAQAQAFNDRYGGHLESRQRQALEAFLKVPSCGFLERRKILLKHHVLPANDVRKLLWLLWA